LSIRRDCEAADSNYAGDVGFDSFRLDQQVTPKSTVTPEIEIKGPGYFVHIHMIF